jgi:hypothetical protein
MQNQSTRLIFLVQTPQNAAFTTKRDLVQELTPKVQIKMEHFFLQKSIGGSGRRRAWWN